MNEELTDNGRNTNNRNNRMEPQLPALDSLDEDILRQEISAERERYLERSYQVGRSPAFVIELSRKTEGDFTMEDVRTAVKIRNALIGEDKNAVDNVHNEADGLHVSGLLLHPDGLENLKRVISELSEPPAEGQDSLYNPDLQFKIAMATPHKGGIQYITLDRNGKDFTIFGPAVLAEMRGEKVEATTLKQIPVYRLAHKDDEPANTIKGMKDTSIIRNDLETADIEWATEEQINALPKEVFEKIDPDSIDFIDVDMNDFMAVKADINKSGEKINNTLDPDDPLNSGEDAQLIVAVNFDLAGSIEELIKIRAEDAGETAIVVNRLGESRIWFLQRSKNNSEEHSIMRGTYEALMRDMAERGVPDFFLKIEDINKHLEQIAQQNMISTESGVNDDEIQGEPPIADRAEYVGQLTSIEMPLKGMVRIFHSKGRAIAINKRWSAVEEKAREDAHKKLGMRPSEIYAPEN